MTDDRQSSGVFDLVTRTVDEAGRRFVDPLRTDIAGLKVDVERVRLDVHDLREGRGMALRTRPVTRTLVVLALNAAAWLLVCAMLGTFLYIIGGAVDAETMEIDRE